MRPFKVILLVACTAAIVLLPSGNKRTKKTRRIASKDNTAQDNAPNTNDS